MTEIASLIREFPFGSFLIISGIITGAVTVATAYVTRHRPIMECSCLCCRDDKLDDEDDDYEDEDED